VKFQRQIDKLLREVEIPQDIASVLSALCKAANDLSKTLLTESGGTYEEIGITNPTGDSQSMQDKNAEHMFSSELRRLPEVGHFVSEEAQTSIRFGDGCISVAIDPFDGSKAFRFGIPAGTIFALFRNSRQAKDFNGERLVASGFFLYGLRTEVFFAISGRVFVISKDSWAEISKLGDSEGYVCFNFSNLRNFTDGWHDFFADYMKTGGVGSNGRWYGCLCVHAKATIMTGGLFAYPPDKRKGYERGHLRFVYEALPIAYLIECLGGAATDGERRILEIIPDSLHQKTPFAFGEKALIKKLMERVR
jgi:fructose-1,6-bisphosphatase I